MSGPPPPPPLAPPPMMPPPPVFSPSKGGGGPDDRSALLNSIRKGAKLKKAVTNDKSAPVISGKVSSSNNNTSSSGGFSNHSSSAPTPNGLGGLFAGGMPKLRPTGKLGTGSSNFNSSNSNNNNSGSSNNSIRQKLEAPNQPFRNESNIQNELRKKLASDNKNRGPPPPAPVRSYDDSNNRPPLLAKNSTSNGIHSSQMSLHSNSSLQLNSSTLHRKAKSNANLTTLDSINSYNNGDSLPVKPVINHGKPNLAPKPPAINGKPMAPPKKLIMNGKPVHRAQSMKSPRSPSPQSPDSSASAIKFGTVRTISSVISQSLGHSTGNLNSPRARPMLNGRPSAPPPSIPPQQHSPVPPQHSPSPSFSSSLPLPPSKTNIVKPPNHAPPPPPSVITGPLPQPPSHAPPPPPHRMRPPPAVPSNAAPPPPPRHSSMREPATPTAKKILFQDFDEKFQFKSMKTFPKPPPFRTFPKVYSNKQAASKQQAPQPPQLQASGSNRTWDTATSC